MNSDDRFEAEEGFEAFCMLADDIDKWELNRQFERISAMDPLKTEIGENLNATGLILNLAFSRNEACFHLLLDLLDDKDEWVREKVCENLRWWPRPETISRMSPLVSDSSQWVRTQAIVTLAELAPDRFIEDVIKLSKSTDFYDRALAALAFGNTKLDRAATYLEILSADENEQVRNGARAALGILGTPAAVDILVRMLNSSDAETRKDAREALRKLGKEPPLFLESMHGNPQVPATAMSFD
jgi:hypothetical protein